MATYDAALAPSGLIAAAVLIDPLFAMGRARNIPFAMSELSDLYLDELSDLPADLLERAVRATRATWKWGNCMPAPADIREHVAVELGRRKRDRGRLQLALQRLPARPRDRSNRADQAAGDVAFAAARAALAKAPVRMMERARDDDRSPTDPHAAATRGRAMLTGLSLDERIQYATGRGQG